MRKTIKIIILSSILISSLNAEIFTMLSVIWKSKEMVNSYISKRDTMRLSKLKRIKIKQQEDYRIIRDTNERITKMKKVDKCKTLTSQALLSNLKQKDFKNDINLLRKYFVINNLYILKDKYYKIEDLKFQCLEDSKTFVKKYYSINYYDRTLNNKERKNIYKYKTKNRNRIVSYCKMRYSKKNTRYKNYSNKELKYEQITCSLRNFNLNNLN